MVKIETQSTGIKIELKGNELMVAYEVAKIAENLAKEDELIADALIFGLIHVYPKEKIIERVKSAEETVKKNAEEIVNNLDDKAVTKLLKDILEGLKDE